MREGVVVPVAIDLGIMRLGRAQRLANPAERKAELEQAEKTFLAVRGIAGDQAQFRLSLAQVYYWLGRPDEGWKLFDEVLKADGRKVDTVLLVASLLRELGVLGQARSLLEEAWKLPGTEAQDKEKLAFLRALSCNDLDDEIVWLERCDPVNPQVKASLAESKGRKALRENKDAEAATFFREAVAVYAAQPESAATLNNGGLASQALYRATGELEALQKGARMMEKALSLKPGDGILAGNVADVALASCLGELVAGRVDLRLLKRQASLSDLHFLYHDPDTQRALRDRLQKNPALARARSHFDRALILAPNNIQLYSSYDGLLSFLEDRPALENLDRRAAEAKPDLSAARQEIADFLQGKKDEQMRRDLIASVARAERFMAEADAPGEEQRGPTFAIAVEALLHARQGQETLGMDFDVDALVSRAQEAHKRAPSAGTVGMLQGALLLRASRALAKQEPEYAALVKKLRRSLSAGHLIAVALGREGKLRTAALANPDVGKALELIRAEAARFPEEPSEWSWAMLRAAHPEDARRIARALEKNELVRVERSLEARLGPSTTSLVLKQSWALEAAGKKDEARKVLQRAAAEGVLLP
jgi:hypothetical protein